MYIFRTVIRPVLGGCVRLIVLRNAVLFLATLSAAVFLSGASSSRALSPYAEAVAKIIKFDRQVLFLMKEESGGSIHRMVGYDGNHFQIIVNGLFVPVPRQRTDAVLGSLRKKLKPLKYMAFVIEINESIKTDKIGVLKGTDQYEILRVMHTDGEEYDITNSDLIERLKEWEKKWPFDIIGADRDWVEIRFRKVPADLKAFAEEVYDFCPDAVDEGPGTPAKLAHDIRQSNKLFLSWKD